MLPRFLPSTFSGLAVFLPPLALGIFGSSRSSSTSNYSAEQNTIDASANAAGASTLTLSGDRSRLDIDNSVDNSTDLRGNVGTTSGDGNTVLGTGASVSADTYNIQEISGSVVSRGLDSLDRNNAAAFGFAGGALGLAGDALGRSLQSADAAYAGGLSFGKRALESTDAAYAGGLGFGESALKVVSDFGSSTIQNANDRADSALAAIERLAAVPTERNAAPDSKAMLWLFAGLGLLALLLGARRSPQS